MSEYKTKLEEFTIEELKTIVDEAPSGWEDYMCEDEWVFPTYLKDNRTSRFCIHTESYKTWEVTAPDYRSVGFHTREDIFKRIDTLEFTFSNIEIEISEFVNEVKFVDGKVYLDIDKEDIEGVIRLLEEKINE